MSWQARDQGKRSGRFAWLRVRPVQDWGAGPPKEAEGLWLLIEEQADGKRKYALSNLPPETTCQSAVQSWKASEAAEEGYRQMTEKLGLNHFEGRSWHGFHHHACLVMLAYGFLALEQVGRGAGTGSAG